MRRGAVRRFPAMLMVDDRPGRARAEPHPPGLVRLRPEGHDRRGGRDHAAQRPPWLGGLLPGVRLADLRDPARAEERVSEAEYPGGMTSLREGELVTVAGERSSRDGIVTTSGGRIGSGVLRSRLIGTAGGGVSTENGCESCGSGVRTTLPAGCWNAGSIRDRPPPPARPTIGWSPALPATPRRWPNWRSWPPAGRRISAPPRPGSGCDGRITGSTRCTTRPQPGTTAGCGW